MNLIISSSPHQPYLSFCSHFYPKKPSPGDGSRHNALILHLMHYAQCASPVVQAFQKTVASKVPLEKLLKWQVLGSFDAGRWMKYVTHLQIPEVRDIIFGIPVKKICFARHHRQSWLEYSPHNDGYGQWIPGRGVFQHGHFPFPWWRQGTASLLHIVSLQIVYDLNDSWLFSKH